VTSPAAVPLRRPPRITPITSSCKTHHHVDGRARHQVWRTSARQSRRQLQHLWLQRQLQLRLAPRFQHRDDGVGQQGLRLCRRRHSNLQCSAQKLNYTTGPGGVTTPTGYVGNVFDAALFFQDDWRSTRCYRFWRSALGVAKSHRRPQRLGAARGPGLRRRRTQDRQNQNRPARRLRPLLRPLWPGQRDGPDQRGRRLEQPRPELH